MRVLGSLSLVLPVVCLAPSPTFGGIVHEEQPQRNTMKGSNFRRPRGGVQRTARTVDPDNDVTRMMGGVTHSISVSLDRLGAKAWSGQSETGSASSRSAAESEMTTSLVLSHDTHGEGKEKPA